MRNDGVLDYVGVLRFVFRANLIHVSTAKCGAIGLADEISRAFSPLTLTLVCDPGRWPGLGLCAPLALFVAFSGA